MGVDMVKFLVLVKKEKTSANAKLECCGYMDSSPAVLAYLFLTAVVVVVI